MDRASKRAALQRALRQVRQQRLDGDKRERPPMVEPSVDQDPNAEVYGSASDDDEELPGVSASERKRRNY